MAKPNYTISTEVDEDLLLRLDAEAQRRGMNRFALVGQLLAEALNAPQTSNADILAAVERLHERLDYLEHLPSALPDSGAIPLPPAPAPELMTVATPTPEPEPMVELTSEELADLLESEAESEPVATDPVAPEPMAENEAIAALDSDSECLVRPSPDVPAEPKPEAPSKSEVEPEPMLAVAPDEAESEAIALEADPLEVRDEPEAEEENGEPLVEVSDEQTPESPQAQPPEQTPQAKTPQTTQNKPVKTPVESIAQRREPAELNFDELCQHIGIHPQELTAAAYKHDQNPISALAWRTGWQFNAATQRFTQPPEADVPEAEAPESQDGDG